MKKVIQYCLLLLLLSQHNNSFSQIEKKITSLNKSFKKNRFINFERAHKIASKIIVLSENNKDKNSSLIALQNMSEILYLQKENTQTKDLVIKGISLAKDLNKKNYLATFYNRLGALEKRANNYTLALEYYTKALNYANNHSKKDIPAINNNIARLYWITNEKQNAEILLRETIKNNTIEDNATADAYNFLGILNFDKAKDSSLIFYKKALQVVKHTKNKYLEGIITSNLGDLYLSLKNIQESFESLNISEKISREVGDKATLHYINMSLGIYYERKGNYKTAIEKYKKAVESYGKYVDDYQKIKAYWTASGVFYHAENYKDAYLYLDNYIELNEKILSLEKKKEFEKIKTEYDVQKKNNQIVLLKKEKELEAINKRIVLITSFLLISLLSILAFFYKHRVRVQKTIRRQEAELFSNEKKKLQQQQKLKKIEGYIEGQEKEKNRIAKELHDGIGGNLIGISHLIYTMNKNTDTSEWANIADTVLSISNEVRSLSHNLSAYYSNHKSFEILLADLKNYYESTNLLKVNIAIFPKNILKHIEKDKKHHLYRIIQELFTNTSKHAQADTIQLSFTKHETYLSIIFEDNGQGFSLNEHHEGIGFKNIKERILNIKGKILIDSTINKGTTITIEILDEHV